MNDKLRIRATYINDLIRELMGDRKYLFPYVESTFDDDSVRIGASWVMEDCGCTIEERCFLVPTAIFMDDLTDPIELAHKILSNKSTYEHAFNELVKSPDFWRNR